MNNERDRGRERDLVMAPNEYAFISDETKGNVNVYVGPHKTSLANTDQPVIFDPATKRFVRCSLEQATQTLSIAPEGWYLVLKNPARDGSHPRTGALNNLPDLEIGRKVNIPGPVSFALWPGQMVRVLQGHHLRSNQYLLVRVYDEGAAKANWKNAVIKPQVDGVVQAAPSPDNWPTPEELTMGKVLVIKGTEVSFYIPPTGVEVVADESDAHVRDAITLERLEYCVLLDEDGNKRYIRGPAVVFPRPTETFVERSGTRRFRAIELNENSGLYLKIIAPYEESGASYREGDELFLTGREQMIYFPRPEHAIVKYGDREIHYAVAIPAGEARYVLDRHTGRVNLHRGPSIFLPDPRKEVIVRRVLDERTVSLWFPGNSSAAEYNRRLSQIAKPDGKGDVVVDDDARNSLRSSANAPAQLAQESVPVQAFAGDELQRKQNFSRPRTIVLDTRFDGAVSIDVWTGYAVMVVSRSGTRKVLVGPDTHLLEYDETLQPMELSTGTPKSDTALLRTAYLRVLHNKISDRIEAETRDLCKVHLTVSYRVNFEGDPARWFDVENYVKFLTDHLRSLVRAAVKKLGVEAFYAAAAATLRDVVLGLPGEDGKRPGRAFQENGMRIYDVEVLDVVIGDETIAGLLVGAQHDAVQQALALATDQRRLEFARQSEAHKQQLVELQSATKQRELELRVAELDKALAVQRSEVTAELERAAQKRNAEARAQEELDKIHSAQLARQKQAEELGLEVAQRKLQGRLQELDGEVRAVSEKAKAVSPDLIAALQAFGERGLAEKMAESMAPMALLGGESVAEILAKLLAGTPAAKVLERGPTPPPSGTKKA